MVKKGKKIKQPFAGLPLKLLFWLFALCVPDACFLGQPHNSSGCCRACFNRCCDDVLSKVSVHVKKYSSRGVFFQGDGIFFAFFLFTGITNRVYYEAYEIQVL